MATNFPTSLDVFVALVDNEDNIVAAHPNDRGDAIEALEAKVGVDSSAVSTSHDYKFTHLPSQAQNWDAGSYEIRAETLESDVATGTAPLTIASTTVVTNLNADKVDGADLDTNTSLGTSDVKIPSQNAVKTYADTKLAASYLDTDGALTANSDVKVASQKATKTYADTKMLASYLDTDGTFAANSDVKVPSQKAAKTYVDGKIDTDTTLGANSDTLVASQKAGKTYADTKIPKSDIDTTTTLGTSDTKVPSQKAVKTYVDGKDFGSWVDKSSSYGAQQAESSGFVVVYGVTSDTSQSTLTVYTDANSNPTTIRGAMQLDANDFPDRGQLMCPVKKGDYWKVVKSGTLTEKVYWIPLG
jgi:hypothetical protein